MRLKPVIVSIAFVSLLLVVFQACTDGFNLKKHPSKDTLDLDSNATPTSPTTEPTSSNLKSADECKNPKDDWIFCNSMTDHNLAETWSNFNVEYTYKYKFITQAGPLGESRRVLQLRIPEGRGGLGVKKVFSQPKKRLYARWYIQYEQGFDLNAANHGGGLHGGYHWNYGRSNFRPQGNDWFSAWIEYDKDNHKFFAYAYYRGMHMDCSDPNGYCWGDHLPCMLSDNYCKEERYKPQPGKTPPTINPGQWYCIEQMLDAGDAVQSQANANGILNFWIDGKEIGPWNDLWLRTANSGTNADNGATYSMDVSTLNVGLFHHGEHSVAGNLVSNIVVSTKPIGCL